MKHLPKLTLLLSGLLLASCGIATSSSQAPSSSAAATSQSEPSSESQASSIAPVSSQASESSQAPVSSEGPVSSIAPFSSEEPASSQAPASSSSSESSSQAPSSSVAPSSSEATSSSQFSSSSVSSSSQLTPIYKPITTKTIESLPQGFIMGMDASSVIALEDSGVVYRDEYGQEQDVFAILAENGVNSIRVRVWNDPYDKDGHGYGGGNNDVAKAIAIGKRATANGMKLHVDFHYSDFWADPAKQMVPKAWKDMTIDQKKQALYDFTKDSLNQMKEQNIEVGMVQVGNETNQGKMCGETSWENTVALMKEGSKAIREVYPNALVATHFTEPQKRSGSISYPVYFASKLNQLGLDYDVFGCSYYPYWHGTLENLQTELSTIASRYNKKVMVMETSYAYTTADTDYYSNTSPQSGDPQPHPHTIQGQYDQVYDVIDTIRQTTGGIGVCYWEGTWISVNQKSKAKNQELWEKYGSGWASSYAKEYDPNDAGKWYGGDPVDNQAFFDRNGNVLPSLAVFNCGKDAGEVTPTSDTFKVLVNGKSVTYVDVKSNQQDLLGAQVELKKGDLVAITKGKDTYDFYHYDETTKQNVDDGLTYQAAADGTYQFYVNSVGEIWTIYKAPSVEPIDGFSFLVNGVATAYTDIKTSSNDQLAAQVSLKTGDKVQIKKDSTTYGFYHWDGQAILDGYEYEVPTDGTYKFYLNSSNQIWVS